MSDCDHCRNHWCCELEYKDKCEHCFFENPTDEYNATFTQEYKYGYQQGRADVCNAITDLCTRWVDDDGICWNTDCPFCDDVCKIEQLKEQFANVGKMIKEPDNER